MDSRQSLSPRSGDPFGRRVEKPVGSWVGMGLGLALVMGRGLGADGFMEPWLAETPSLETLQTRVIALGPEDGRGLPDRLQYEIGFSTDETAATGFLFDSLTISLARGDGTGSTVLVTGDVFGLTIAPLTPGGLLASGGISVNETVPRVPLLAGAGVSYAYTVEVTLPPTLSGAELVTTFGFFNNGDAVASRGYAMVVPEPGLGTLMGLGLGLGFGVWLRRQRGGLK